jgi:L-threonylcarbamoyladenylate synthase
LDIYLKAAKILKQGGIIAYPTEAVLGIGCDPFNEQAVLKLLQLKKRSVAKGVILIAANWEQIKNLTAPIDNELLEKVFATWPGPYTWVFPASDSCPKWISGEYPTVALRVTKHEVAKAICDKFSEPIVSTSANIENNPPARSLIELHSQFPQGIDLIIPGEIGGLEKPTSIMDVLTGKMLRE